MEPVSPVEPSTIASESAVGSVSGLPGTGSTNWSGPVGGVEAIPGGSSPSGADAVIGHAVEATPGSGWGEFSVRATGAQGPAQPGAPIGAVNTVNSVAETSTLRYDSAQSVGEWQQRLDNAAAAYERVAAIAAHEESVAREHSVERSPAEQARAERRAEEARAMAERARGVYEAIKAIEGSFGPLVEPVPPMVLRLGAPPAVERVASVEHAAQVVNDLEARALTAETLARETADAAARAEEITEANLEHREAAEQAARDARAEAERVEREAQRTREVLEAIRRWFAIVASSQHATSELAVEAAVLEVGRDLQSYRRLQEALAAHPETSPLAIEVMNLRNRIVSEVLTRWPSAAILGDASVDVFSDIDLQFDGPDAVKSLLEVEEFLRERTGSAEWDKVLHVNCYLGSARLKEARAVLKKLPPDMLVQVDAEIGQKAKLFMAVRMLEHAGTDEAALARVRGYLQAFGVNEDEARVLIIEDEDMRREVRNELMETWTQVTDDFVKAMEDQQATGEERLRAARRVMEAQMATNLYTNEAYIDPFVLATMKSESERTPSQHLRAMMGELAMIEHRISEAGRNLIAASREYELYKYIGRFVEHAQRAGYDTDKLTYLQHVAEYVNKTWRMANTGGVLEDGSQLVVSKKGLGPMATEYGPGARPPMTAEHLESEWSMFQAEVSKIIMARH